MPRGMLDTGKHKPGSELMAMEIHEKPTDAGIELHMTDKYMMGGREWDFGAIGTGRDREEALNDLADRAAPKQLKAVFDSMLQDQRGSDPKDSLPAAGSEPVKSATAPVVPSLSSPLPVEQPQPPAQPPTLAHPPVAVPSIPAPPLSPSSSTPGGIVLEPQSSPVNPAAPAPEVKSPAVPLPTDPPVESNGSPVAF